MAKLDMQCGKFLDVLKKPYMNIPFTEALSQMPSYAKFLKEILSSKRKLEEHETVALTEVYSAAIQNKLPAKLMFFNSLLDRECAYKLFFVRLRVKRKLDTPFSV